MIIARVQLRIAIDSLAQAPQCGPRPPMLPQVLSAHICTDRAESKTAAWSWEHWVDLPPEADGNTYEEAHDKLVTMLEEAPQMLWIYHLLSEQDRRTALNPGR
jgi:hypothetical protein